MTTISLQSDALRAVVDPDRGGEILFVGPRSGPNVLYHEPWDEPTPAGPELSYGSPALDWISHYRGGWQAMFPNAGLECVVDGVMHPLHGELWSAPAHVIERSDTDLVMRWTTRQLLRLERRISLPGAKPVIFVEERIENDTEHQVAYAWGHHPAFAAAPGTRIDLPPGPVHIDENAHDPEVDLLPGAAGRWPWVAGRTGGNAALDRIPEPPVERVCYLPDRRAGWAALRDLQSGRGVGVAWDVDAYPHLWLWENFGVARFPFHGRARLVTLEPVSCWPSDGLAKAIERGRARWLGPRSGASSWVTVSLFAASRQSAVAVERDGQVRLANELSPRSVLET